MSRSVARGLLVSSVVAVVLCAPAASSACECLDWLWPWNWCRGTRAATTYAPPFTPAATTVAPAFTPQCNPCVSQTCSYVPQTCYRSVSSVVPVTACQPITSCDPCTGCPVTSYRPVTVYQRTTQLIPYTTYRMVWSNPCAAAPCATVPCATSCAPCGTAYAPAVGGSGCCGAQAPVTSAAPLVPSPAPVANGAPPITFAPSNGAAMPLSNGAGAMPLPGPAQTLGTPNGATTPSLENRNLPINDPTRAPKPVDDKVEQSPGQGVQLNAPTTNLQAFRPIRQVQYVSDSRTQRPGATMTGPVDFGGWRASTD